MDKTFQIKEKKTKITKQKKDRYEMHKYWGKKPSSDLSKLINKYSNIGDVLLDPFSGYGVFCCESYILQRNIVSNDLNPISSFIQKQLFQKNINFSKLDKEYNKIIEMLKPFVDDWYRIDKYAVKKTAITILRNKDDKPIKCKYKNANEAKFAEHLYTENEIAKFRDFENGYIIEDWLPDKYLIENSRISVKPNMKVSDLFTKRTLACHARLLRLIKEISSGTEMELLLLAFTSNLANCSKLVPPIKTRGDMSQGAWMTGFYTGSTYLENNVLHYFQNRFNKVVKGKKDYLDSFCTLFHTSKLKDLGEVKILQNFGKNSYGYLIISEDTKNLSLNDETIDYIFTDPPYGDSVPYFEQSEIWNSWLSNEVDYDNEIVISNSSLRDKNISVYKDDIEKAIKEIYRVLRTGKYFSMTFHSLSGYEWNCVSNACIKAGFEIEDFIWLTQKAFTPRQINREKTVKGDVLITFKKISYIPEYSEYSKEETIAFFRRIIRNIIDNDVLETNAIFMEVIKEVFFTHAVLANVNFFGVLKAEYVINDGEWSKKR